MRDIWFIGDTHFGHEKILTFKDDFGEPLRKFNSIQEMDMVLIGRWNACVKPHDIVYHMGDVAFSKQCMDYFKILNGRKRLVKGNHDLYKTSLYAEHFDQIHGVKHLYVDGIKFLLSHVPVHPDCMDRFDLNIHGHLHINTIDDERYFNVCVERTNYTPINIDQIKAMTGIKGHGK